MDQLQKDMDFVTAGMGEADLMSGQVHRGLLDQVIDHYLIVEFARQNDISVTEDEFRTALDGLQEEYTEGGFQEALLRGSADAEEWQQRLREQLLVQKVLRKVTSDVAPPDYDEIKQYYDAHKGEYTTPRMLRFRQILTRTEKEARDLLERIQQGEDMGELARDHSIAPEADQDGDVGWIANGQLEDSMEKALFSLGEGEVSGVVETPYGYHIFQVTGKRPKGTRELPEVVQEIESRLLVEKREAFCRNWLEGLRGRFTVEVDPKLLKGG
jgi:parvulin-like peptidyl-prolyl isomerase